MSSKSLTLSLFLFSCEMVQMNKNLYQKKHPPLSKETHKADVMVNITVFMIENFNEKELKFDAKFMVQMEW
jgi:hypothetical protein